MTSTPSSIRTPPTRPDVLAVAMTGDRLVGPDARLVRGVMVAIVGFAIAVAVLIADWSWLAVALFWGIGWQLERHTFVQHAGPELLVRNRVSRHLVARSDVAGITTATRLTGVRAVLVLHDGTRLPIVAFTLVEPSDAAIDSMLDQLARELGVPRLESVV